MEKPGEHGQKKLNIVSHPMCIIRIKQEITKTEKNTKEPETDRRQTETRLEEQNGNTKRKNKPVEQEHINDNSKGFLFLYLKLVGLGRRGSRP